MMLLKRLFKFFDDRYNLQVLSLNLGVVRFFLATIFFHEVWQLLQMQEVIFPSRLQGLDLAIRWAPILYLWLVVLVFLAIGFLTRFSAIVNYVLAVVTFGTFSRFEYHFDYVILGASFIFLILPVQKSFSIDSLFKKLINHSKKQTKPSVTIRQIHYDLFIFACLGLVYFDSVFFKLQSPMWLKGFGLWLPASLPQSVFINFSWLLNQEVVCRVLGYLTLLFEIIFIFVFWFSWFRWPLILVGVGLHIGILLAFPIPDFAIGCGVFYLLLLPHDFFKKLFAKIQFKKPFLTIYIDMECPLCQRTKIILEHFDIFKAMVFSAAQDDNKHPNIAKIEMQNLLDAMHAVDRKGKVYAGYFAYLKILQYLFFGFPLFILFSLPGIKQLGNATYQYVAKNRFREHCDEESCLMPEPEFRVDDLKILNNLTIGAIKKKVFFSFCAVLTLSQLALIVPKAIFLIEKLNRAPILTIKEYHEQTNTTQLIKTDNEIFAFANRDSQSYGIFKWLRIILGVTHHPVFMDSHFEMTKKIMRISVVQDGREYFLPVYDDLGQPDSYLRGRFWVNWTFKSMLSAGDPQVFLNHIQSYLYKFSRDNQIELSQAIIRVYSKPVAYTKEWQFDYLNQQLQKPWQLEKEFTFHNTIQLFEEK